MKVESQYVLTRMEGETRWYLWEGERYMAPCKYILYHGDDPVELVRKVFEVPGRASQDKTITIEATGLDPEIEAFMWELGVAQKDPAEGV